ncbi:MAG: phosphate acetyltransferase [Candidatus Omnitrophica bacterium]|nr:phosphate acetyltransferase [Candidatus Omnitrophota bacterium]
MDILKKIHQRAKEKKRKIVLPETDDARVLEATKVVVEEGLADVILLSSDSALKSKADSIGLNLSSVKIVNPKADQQLLKKFTTEFYELRKHKGITMEAAQQQIGHFVYFAAMMVRNGLADGFVAGAGHTTPDVAKAAIYCIGFTEKLKTISSSFLVIVPDCEYGHHGIFIFSDCGIVPDPSAAQLANIAESAAELFGLLVEEKPRVALLSFSSKGSANHPLVEKVVKAKQIINEKYPDLIVDGELQLDAAIVPQVAKIKAPQSDVAGSANVLIFPGLESGNIGYKLVQRLAKAQVIGPMMTGLRKPCSDLSRGCTIDEIVNAVCTTAIRVVD